MSGRYQRIPGKQIPVADDESEEGSDPRQALPTRRQRKSPDKGEELLERVDTQPRRSTRTKTQNRDVEFDYSQKPRKTTPKVAQDTGRLRVNKQQGTQVSTRNERSEEPGTITKKSVKAIVKNLGKSNASGVTFPERETMGTKATDRARSNRASKGSEKATKQLITKIKGGSNNKPVKMSAKAGGPPSSPSSSSSGNDSSSRSRSHGRGGDNDSDDSEDEEEEPEDNDSDDARSSDDESPSEDPQDSPSDPDESEEPSDSESEESRDGEDYRNIIKAKKAAVHESIQILSTMLETAEKYSKSQDKKKTLHAASYVNELNVVGEKILRDELTLSASEKRFLSGTNVPWTVWYTRHLKKCEEMSTILIKLIKRLDLIGELQAATHSINTSGGASEHRVDCNAQAVLPIAGVVFNQLHELLYQEGVHDDEWEASNRVWLTQLPTIMDRATKASSNLNQFSKQETEKRFTNFKGMESLRRELKTTFQKTLQQLHGVVLSCAGFAITVQTIIHDYDKQFRNLIDVPRDKSSYEENRIRIAREALMSLDPNDCDTDVQAIIEHMQQRGKEIPLNGEMEPARFNDWIKWITNQATEVTLQNAITITMNAIYSAPALGDSVYHAKTNFYIHLMAIENSYRRVALHPLSKKGAMKKILEDQKTLVLSNYVHMAEAILTPIAKQYKSETHAVLANWLDIFQRGIQDEASKARFTVARLRNDTRGYNTEKTYKSEKFVKFYAALENEDYESLDYTEGLISEVIGPAIWKVIKQFIETYSKMQRRKPTEATVHHVTGHLRDTHLGAEQNTPVKEEQEATVMTLKTVDSDPEVDWDSLEHVVHNVGIETRGNACFGCKKEGHTLKECPEFSAKLNQLKKFANELVKDLGDAEGPAFSALITDLKSSNEAFQAFISKFRGKSSYQKRPSQRFIPRQ